MPTILPKIFLSLGSATACFFGAHGIAWADTEVWQPSAGHEQIPLWPAKSPNAEPKPGPERMETGTDLIAGKPVVSVTNVSTPTLTFYAPEAATTGAIVLVIPGGGFEILAMDLEGTEVCDWLVAKGIACALLKYRVPSHPYHWQDNTRPHNLEVPIESLEDAQRAMRLIRAHADEWHIEADKVGVLGFSAGGYLVAEISTRYDKRMHKPIDAVDRNSARPDFAVAVYPGHLSTEQERLNPNVPVTKDTPPTFIVQAEDDHVDGVEQALVYFRALSDANVPAEMHLYAKGGHAFGLRRTDLPITQWPRLVEAWLHTSGIVPNAARP
jgi:acetyl esterase/lipase